jgi:hypothetical protein
VRPILDGDQAFYRPHGEDDATAVARVSSRGENGELLGYGARRYQTPQGAKVTLMTVSGVTYMFFVSQPELAELFAAERAADIHDYTGAEVRIQIEYPD